jgi:hypothetical protein
MKNVRYPAHLTTYKPDLNPVRMGKRVRQDFLHNTPCFFSAALIFFPDYIHFKANPDSAPLLSIRLSFHDVPCGGDVRPGIPAIDLSWLPV